MVFSQSFGEKTGKFIELNFQEMNDLIASIHKELNIPESLSIEQMRTMAIPFVEKIQDIFIKKYGYKSKYLEKVEISTGYKFMELK